MSSDYLIPLQEKLNDKENYETLFCLKKREYIDINESSKTQKTKVLDTRIYQKLFYFTLALVGCFSIYSFKKSTELDFPSQVFLAIGGENSDAIAITWISKENTSTEILYSSNQSILEDCLYTGKYENCIYKKSLNSISLIQTKSYQSGYIHKIITKPLKPNTLFYYVIGDFDLELISSILTFQSPPLQSSNTNTKLAILGDPGQTSQSIKHFLDLEEQNVDAVIAVGDLSYADGDGKRWDSWGTLVSKLSSSSTPWMMLPGNHDIEEDVKEVNEENSIQSFIAFQKRFRMPFKESFAQQGNLYYSFNLGNIHVIMLSTYSSFTKSSLQYTFLENDLRYVNRTRTPWILIGMHAPWYSTNKAHQKEMTQKKMRKEMEKLLFTYHVDIIFSGHVHAYEHILPVYNMELNPCGPHYIVNGNAGNREGLSSHWLEAKPYSKNRKTIYGYGIFESLNATHATFTLREQKEKIEEGDYFMINKEEIKGICYDKQIL